MIATSLPNEAGACKPIALTAYVDHAYESVCSVLTGWSAASWGDVSIGMLERPSTFVARVAVWQPSTSVEAELRVLPVLTGCDAVTELLLVIPADPHGERAALVDKGRVLLDRFTREVDSALSSAGGQSSWP